MTRINIDVTEKLHKQFKNLAHRNNVSMSRLIKNDIVNRVLNNDGEVRFKKQTR